MAYQHLFGSSSGGASGAGYRTLASTPEFYNVMSDDELSSYNNYSFTSGDDHPVKFCHCYKEYKQCFIQSSVSFERDYVGRNSSVAHTLVLSEAESRYILNEHICPFSPAMFMNSKSEQFDRSVGETLPAVDYRFLACRDRGYNIASVNRIFKSDIFVRFVMALLRSAENSSPVFIALPGSPREASYNAIRLMNIIIPAFPAEYKKKLGFMTHVTDTYAYEDVSVYFTDSIDLSRQFVNGGACFDLTREKPYVSGVETNEIKEYTDLLRAVISNIFSYDSPTLNDYYNDIQPKLEEYDRFSLPKINEIFYMWRFLSGNTDTQPDSKDACRIISSFYSFNNIVDNKAEFLNRINGYWEKEIKRCRDEGYVPDIGIFDIVNSHYPSFSEEDKRQTQRIWSFVLIYTLSDGRRELSDRIFTSEYDGSELIRDIYKYIAGALTGSVLRKDSNKKMRSVYEHIISAYMQTVKNDGDYFRLFRALADTIDAVERFYNESGSERGNDYAFFSSVLLPYFNDGIAETLNNAGIMSKFRLIKELKEQIYGTGGLGITVFQHFQSIFISGIASGFTAAGVLKMADDRKAVSELLEKAEEYPELGSVDMIALLQRYWNLLNKPRDITSITELNKLVNKPDQQKAFTEWVEVYSKKYPELMLSIIANTVCHIGSGASIVYETDYMKAFTSHYENTECDDETIMRDLNRLIPEIESYALQDTYRVLGLGAFQESAVRFLKTYLLDRSVDKKRAKENEARLKRFDKVKRLIADSEGKRKK